MDFLKSLFYKETCRHVDIHKYKKKHFSPQSFITIKSIPSELLACFQMRLKPNEQEQEIIEAQWWDTKDC